MGRGAGGSDGGFGGDPHEGRLRGAIGPAGEGGGRGVGDRGVGAEREAGGALGAFRAGEARQHGHELCQLWLGAALWNPRRPSTGAAKQKHRQRHGEKMGGGTNGKRERRRGSGELETSSIYIIQ